MEEPQYYATTAEALIFHAGAFDRIAILDNDLELIDATYVPFHIAVVRWLLIWRLHDTSLPRPEVWLTDHFKLNPLDSTEAQDIKCRSYAQVLSFLTPKDGQLDTALLDWATLKTGLEVLIKACGPASDWPTRLLVYAARFQDKQTAQKALKLIAGNYSPDVIFQPQVFQHLVAWAEGTGPPSFK
jgi:hypothetical protein